MAARSRHRSQLRNDFQEPCKRPTITDPEAQASAEDLIAYAREVISRAKYPREVRIVNQLPLTSIGKTDRKALRRILAEEAEKAKETEKA